MRSTYLASVTALGLASVAMPAAAQEATGDGFSGVYVGGSFGATLQPNDRGSSIDFDTDLDGEFGDTVNTSSGANAFSPGFCGGRAQGATRDAGCRNDKDGIEYYGHVGFDRQMGSFVVGAVGEFGRSEAVDSVSAFSTTPARYTMTREAKYNAGLRLRAGYTPNGSTLFYGTGGGAWARIKNSFSTSNGTNAFAGSGNSDAWGWSAGGGVEQKLGGHFSVGLQYLYTRLKDDDYVVRAGPGTAPLTNPFRIVNPDGTDFQRGDDKFNTHSVRATASFRF